jgi:arginine decarboxylase
MNYTLAEYARDIVWNVMDVCDSEKVEHPVLISESGRAIVAHHSVLVVEAFGSIEKDKARVKAVPTPNDPKQVSDILELQKTITALNWAETLHDAQQIKEQSQAMFELGLLELESKAKIEQAYWQIAQQVVTFTKEAKYIPDEVRELEISLGDQYVCNFSVFQSLLDHWALGQLFPVMPIDRLDCFPDRNATLVDITVSRSLFDFCDLQHYSHESVRKLLEYHNVVRDGERDIGQWVAFLPIGAKGDSLLTVCPTPLYQGKRATSWRGRKCCWAIFKTLVLSG